MPMRSLPKRADTHTVNVKTGEVESVILPIADYEVLIEIAEMAEDVAAFDASISANEERFPSALVDRLLEGVNPVRVFREHRKMTQRQLADAADLHQTTISQIETGERSGSVEVFLRLAKALGLDIEDLISRASDV